MALLTPEEVEGNEKRQVVCGRLELKANLTRHSPDSQFLIRSEGT